MIVEVKATRGVHLTSVSLPRSHCKSGESESASEFSNPTGWAMVTMMNTPIGEAHHAHAGAQAR
jgi:hypothetical protein